MYIDLDWDEICMGKDEMVGFTARWEGAQPRWRNGGFV
jgi:hypothetical protein